jgi:hypothetical protein
MKRLYQYEGRLTTRNPNADDGSASLPYNGTSGWSGTDTSRERAVTADTNGDTKDRQRKVMNFLHFYEGHGATWKEIAEHTGWHHGTVSGALSVLHKDKRIARLTQQRDRCRVYVLPEYVYGRETDQQGRKHQCPECGHKF